MQLDINAELVGSGYATAGTRREQHLQGLVREYAELQTRAKRAHKGMWEFGDTSADDAKVC